MKIYTAVLFASVMLNSCSEDTTQPSGSNNAASYTQIDFDPVLSPNKDTIVYVNSNVNFDFTGLYSFDLSNGFNKQLFNGIVGTPDISPINSKIVYSQEGQLAVIDPDGLNSQILNTNAHCNYPKWNSDGSRIIYENSESSDLNGIRITDSQGSFDSLIIKNGRSPAWTDNTGEFIYLISQENKNGDSLYKYDLTSGVKILLYVLNAPDYKTSQYLNYVNGEVIFCSTSETGFSYVYKLNISSGIIEKLAVNQGWSPYYSKTNGMIYYTNRDLGNGWIWIMDINGNGNRQFNEMY